jgi:hypothetical protein
MASFNSAFAAARKAGKKSFSWNGKSYNTKLAPSPAKGPAKNAKVPKPESADMARAERAAGAKNSAKRPVTPTGGPGLAGLRSRDNAAKSKRANAAASGIAGKARATNAGGGAISKMLSGMTLAGRKK